MIDWKGCQFHCFLMGRMIASKSSRRHSVTSVASASQRQFLRSELSLGQDFESFHFNGFSPRAARQTFPTQKLCWLISENHLKREIPLLFTYFFFVPWLVKGVVGKSDGTRVKPGMTPSPIRSMIQPYTIINRPVQTKRWITK